jgi:hypothetical protein
MRQVLLPACVVFGLAACDQSPSGKDSSPPVVKPVLISESVRVTRDTPWGNVQLTLVTSKPLIDGAYKQVAGNGHPCSSISKLWVLGFTLKTSTKILKVSCADRHDYQLSFYDNQAFIKPWSGTLLSN